MLTIKSRFKFITFIVLITFSINSFAFFPLLFGLAAADTAAGAGATTAAEFLATTGATFTMQQALKSSLLFHGSLAMLTFSNPADKITDPNKPPPLQIVLDPNKPLIAPPNWSQALAGSASMQPSPPQTMPPDTSPYYANGRDATPKQYSSLSAACASSISIINSLNPALGVSDIGGCVLTTVDANPPGSAVFNEFYNISVVQGNPRCSSGYQLNSNQCQLINAAVVLKPTDGICQLISTPTSIITDPSDPDCSNSDLLASGIDATEPTKLKITNPSSTDTYTVAPVDPHRVEVEHIYKDPSGNTVHDKIAIDPSPPTPTSPTVTGTAHSVNMGTGTFEQTAASSPSSFTFDKSGLATTTGQSQQLSATNTTNTKLDTANTHLKSIEDAVNCTDCQVLPDTKATDSQTVKDEIKKSTDLIESQGTAAQHEADKGIYSWFFSSPFPTSLSCTPFTRTVMGKTVTIDICNYIDMIKSFLTWSLSIYTCVDLLSLIFRKPT